MRRVDTHWRSRELSERHESWGFTAPFPGMQLPMVEYDKGVPVAILNYLPRTRPLPHGNDVMAAYQALSGLYRSDGEHLPFFTVRYDVRNWAFQILGHNGPAAEFLGHTGWATMTEAEFVNQLYRLRGRVAPELAAYGVDFSHAQWIATEPSPDFAAAETWPGQLMSARRRNYEPIAQVRGSWRNPCVDIDFAVVDRGNRAALIVDYKTAAAKVNLSSTNMRALSSLHARYGGSTSPTSIPAMVVRYESGEDGWSFRVHCLNNSASSHLAYALGATDDSLETLATVVTGQAWITLSAQQWCNVLTVAREL